MIPETAPVPPHSDLLVVHSNDPLNAEPPVYSLVDFPITPHDLVYCRNHGPVRIFDPRTYTLSLSTLFSPTNSMLSLHELKSSFDSFSIEAALQCAGNRRTEMNDVKPVQGVLWFDAAIANCKWTGIRLCDLLFRFEPSCNTAATTSNQLDINHLHVCFASHATQCQDDSYYGASIPLSQALDKDAEVMLAFKMNDESLSPHHGGPLRLVVPGFLGARWVKWVDQIIISDKESPNFYQQRDYKVLPPQIETADQANLVWSHYPAVTSMPLNSVIGSVSVSRADGRGAVQLLVKGYATNGHGDALVERVQVSSDRGRTWWTATITYDGGKWGWRLWEVQLTASNSTSGCSHDHSRGDGRIELVSRAQDANGEYQPEEGTWNIRGISWDGWGRKLVAVDSMTVVKSDCPEELSA